MKKILVIALVLVCTFSIAGTAFGALPFPGGPNTPPAPPFPGIGMPDIQQIIYCINKLVSAGTINQDQADKVINYFKQNKPDPSKKIDPFKIANELKSTGLTVEQARAIADAILPPKPPGIGMPPDMEQQIKYSIDKLVSAGTINQDQADKVINYLKQNKPDPSKSIDPFKIANDLKSTGLTVEQARAVADAILPPKPPGIGMPSDMEQQIIYSINKLVSAGTINQDQADKVINYLKQNKPDPSKNIDPFKIANDLKNIGLTDQQVQAIVELIRPSGSTSS